MSMKRLQARMLWRDPQRPGPMESGDPTVLIATLVD